MLALVDCDDFYVSCERVFQPELRRKPAVVLSNNDGCIVARSAEAKKMGLQMGTPYFKVREKLKNNNVAVRSSNYTLYGDMSRRVESILEKHSPRVEKYSIDEYFLELPAAGLRDLSAYARQLQQKIDKYLGLPVSIGIGPTKTLTKVAMEIAKPPGNKPVQNSQSWSCPEEKLEEIDIDEVWGIGTAYAQKCRRAGINNARDLKEAPAGWLRKRLTVQGLRRKKELEGIRCIPLEEKEPKRKQIVCSRMFGRKVDDFTSLKEATVSYASRAARRLRKENLYASKIHVFVRSRRYRSEKTYKNQQAGKFKRPVRSDHRIGKKATECLDKIYSDNFSYRKSGVILSELVEDRNYQQNLLAESAGRDRKMAELADQINQEHGKNTLKLLGEGLEQDWSMQRSQLSNHYTTRWNELPTVKAG